MWLRLAKTFAGASSLTKTDALDVALCYGWIDARNRSESSTTWLQRFTPRSKKSIWSKVNREKVLALIQAGRMQPAGLEQIERAKEDGRWDAAYGSYQSTDLPADLAAALNANPQALAFFHTLNAKNRYAILFRTETAKKPETRARRIRDFVEMLAKHRTLYP